MKPGAELGKIQALVCEDEPLARRAIREYLKDIDWIEIVAEAANGKEALRLIHKHEPDLVFMDVQMPGLTGIEVLETVTHHAAVVFTTAYDEYAVRAFDLGAVDYLVKPFGRERLLETLDRVRVRLVGEGLARPGSEAASSARPQPMERIFARHGSGVVPVLVSSIVRIDATPGGLSLVTRERTFELDSTLGEIEGRLAPTDFVRVHRSHIVNLAFVAGITRFDERRLDVSLVDGSSVIASRQGSKALREMMG